MATVQQGIREALTFDDVLLKPGLSDVMPGEVDIRFLGPATSDVEARSRMDKVRENWLLRPGQPFRQEEWEAAKRAAVRELSGWRYAAASITSSEARIVPSAAAVAIAAAG